VSRPLRLIELLARVKNLLGEQATELDGSPSASVYWSDAELYRYINDSYIEAARVTKALELIELVPTEANDPICELSDNVGQIFRVTYDNRRLENTTKWTLDRADYNWENQTGYVSHYITSLQNDRTLRLYKTPEEGGGLAVTGGEYGLITSISDGVNTYLFSNEYGVTEDTGGTNWDGDFIGEYGEATITGGVSNTFEVWATKHPDPMDTDSPVAEYPELPWWSHQGIVFRAAARALMKYGEQGQRRMAKAYNAIANDYNQLLKGHVASRSGERLSAMGRAQGPRRPRVYDQLVED
jgi:hypothetical protein